MDFLFYTLIDSWSLFVFLWRIVFISVHVASIAFFTRWGENCCSSHVCKDGLP